MTIKEVAIEMCVTEMTVRRWIKSKRLKACQPFKNAKITIKTEDLENFKRGE